MALKQPCCDMAMLEAQARHRPGAVIAARLIGTAARAHPFCLGIQIHQSVVFVHMCLECMDGNTCATTYGCMYVTTVRYCKRPFNVACLQGINVNTPEGPTV